MIFMQDLCNVGNQICQQANLVKALNRLQKYSNDIFTHSIEVGTFSAILAGFMGVRNVSDIFISGLFHDYGKILIPKCIVEKPGKLTEEEKKVMNIHPFWGYSELKQTTRLSKEILNGVLDHHEKVDGTGYSYGKVKEEISLFGKIISIVDVYSAMAAKRVYRNYCFTHNDIVKKIETDAGTAFDGIIVKEFVKIASSFDNMLIQKMCTDTILNDITLKLQAFTQRIYQEI